MIIMTSKIVDLLSIFAAHKADKMKEFQKDYLKELNDSQREAVVYNDGASLVVAGAGSGKTRVLTYKIAHLIDLGYAPYTILALTFTNKAAKEMKARIAALVGEELASRLWMGTFHSIFSRILRREADRLGYSPNFTIYDSADSKSLIKSIIKNLGLSDKQYRPGMVQGIISKAKNALVSAQSYSANKDIMQADAKAKIPMMSTIYLHYQQRCKQADAMDFDDLLMQTNILFRDYPEVLNFYRERFGYILVDEYQDTNLAQYRIIKQLSEVHQKICVVGDDAQSIYSFRGANIENILKFSGQYDNSKTFKLEQNYRSTQNIVNAANSLISKNQFQIKKTVFSEKQEGNKLGLVETYSDYDEAAAVVALTGNLKASGEDYKDIAILYRTNAQSRVLEDAFRKHSIPYRIYGGLSFYQRKEIKDIIAYLRLIINPHDEEALKRIINYPTRGIGATTLAKVLNTAIENNVSLWTILQDIETYSLPVNKGTAKKLQDFCSMINSMQELSQTTTADEVATEVIKQSGIHADIFADKSIEGISKLENIAELQSAVMEFCQIRKEETGNDVMLQDFLAEVSLLTDQDNQKDEDTNKVTMMTVHAAKGLEFPNVFIVGLEENLFPSQMSGFSPKDIEEERRLLYVAITRAEKNCTLSFAQSRFRNGQTEFCRPSRFINDINPSYINQIRKQDSNPFKKSSALNTEKLPSFSAKTRQLSHENTPESKQSIGDLSINARVMHARFGLGTITKLEGEGVNAKATVDFDSSGKKQLLLKYAKLEVV